ncbi:MAG: YciI family protein [Gammaproteobacteria bacterium]
MLYVIMWDDVKDSLPLRRAVRPEHLARVDDLRKQGRLVLGGPFPAIDAEDPGAAGFTGSLIVAEFDSQQDAQEWIDNDPYAQAGVFTSASVRPFKKVAP